MGSGQRDRLICSFKGRPDTDPAANHLASVVNLKTDRDPQHDPHIRGIVGGPNADIEENADVIIEHVGCAPEK